MKHLLRFSAFQATLYQLREVIMKAILTQSSALTTRYLKIGGDLMKARPIRNRTVRTHGSSMKKLTTLLLFMRIGPLLALGGAPSAWAYPSSATGTYTVNQVGDRVIYTFTGSGTFTPAVGLTGNVLVVAGGGGGGGAQASGSSKYNYGGGGGAGGFYSRPASPSRVENPYTVTVGGGGAAGSYAAKGGNGANSVFGAHCVRLGGGGGGSGSRLHVDANA